MLRAFTPAVRCSAIALLVALAASCDSSDELSAPTDTPASVAAEDSIPTGDAAPPTDTLALADTLAVTDTLALTDPMAPEAAITYSGLPYGPIWALGRRHRLRMRVRARSRRARTTPSPTRS